MQSPMDTMFIRMGNRPIGPAPPGPLAKAWLPPRSQDREAADATLAWPDLTAPAPSQETLTFRHEETPRPTSQTPTDRESARNTRQAWYSAKPAPPPQSRGVTGNPRAGLDQEAASDP